MKYETFMAIARTIATESTCCSKQVGALIVKNDRIISHGYNGSPAGALHCEAAGLREGWMVNLLGVGPTIVDRPRHSAWSEQNEIHAEQNAICYAARNGLAVNNAVMFVTMSPCIHCSKLIVGAGIEAVVVDTVYDRAASNWYQWLKDHGVVVLLRDQDNKYKEL